jgi:ornithine carbamoyltransferase
MNRALELKGGADRNTCPLMGKTVGLLFEKSSTRTRVSFEVGIYELGGHPLVLNSKEIQLNRGESVEDTARVFSRYIHGVVIRTFGHDRIEEFAANATIPVINGLTDTHHPCQALADVLTIYEKKNRIEGVNVTYIGDGNNVANSLIEAAARTGFNLTVCCPKGYEPDADVLMQARSEAAGRIEVGHDPMECAKGADALYTDVWASMGMEDEEEQRKRVFTPYQINSGLLALAKDDAVVLHCLPAHRGLEITDEVMDSPHSVVFDQAENRLHAQKALLEFLLG